MVLTSRVSTSHFFAVLYGKPECLGCQTVSIAPRSVGWTAHRSDALLMEVHHDWASITICSADKWSLAWWLRLWCGEVQFLRLLSNLITRLPSVMKHHAVSSDDPPSLLVAADGSCQFVRYRQNKGSCAEFATRVDPGKVFGNLGLKAGMAARQRSLDMAFLLSGESQVCRAIDLMEQDLVAIHKFNHPFVAVIVSSALCSLGRT